MGKPTLAETDRRNMALLAALHNKVNSVPSRFDHHDDRLRSVLGAIDPSNPRLQAAWEQFVIAVVDARDLSTMEEEVQASSSAAADGSRTIRRRRRNVFAADRAAQPYPDRRPLASDLTGTGPRSADILFRHPRSRGAQPFTPRVVDTPPRRSSPAPVQDEPTTTTPFSPRGDNYWTRDSYTEMFTGDGNGEGAETDAEGSEGATVRPRAGMVPYDLRQILTLSGGPASTDRPTTVAPADLLASGTNREYRSAPPDEVEHSEMDRIIAGLATGSGQGTYAEAVRRSLRARIQDTPAPTIYSSPWTRNQMQQARSPPLYLDPMVHRRPAAEDAETGSVRLNESSSTWAAEYEQSVGRVSALLAGTRRRRSDDYEARSSSQMLPPTLRRTRRRIGEGDDRRRDSVRDSTRDTRRDGIVFPAAFDDYLSLLTTEDDGGESTGDVAEAAVAAEAAALAQLEGAASATETETAASVTDTTAATAATSAAATPNATHTTHSDRPIATLPRRLRLGAE
ncbi:hypothetical protein Q8F55_006566 [Vanrija albida]|uniref:Outer kinetochore protein ASK1 n=1 Tax=Vanrija albida TaxID=181172 RepID=A0ABR3PYE0_9TREE